jgi:RNA-directed DNA polymerase
MITTSQKPYQLLVSCFRVSYLKEIAQEKIKSSTARGIDRLSGERFKAQSESHIKIIHDKCLKGKYKFSPYLELLRTKGRGKNPRLLAIPTVRDRIVLYALKEILFQIFPECVPRDLANTYIRRIREFVNERDLDSVQILYADIEDFYGTVDRDILFAKLKKRIKSLKLLTLLRRAVDTPIVPDSYRKKDLSSYIDRNAKGIPQGLSISNILAAIYLLDLDRDMREQGYEYFRYVDDILIFSDVKSEVNARIRLEESLHELKLKLNDGKTGSSIARSGFDYLGYSFNLPDITVRSSTVERFLQSIVAKFSSYVYSKKHKLKTYQYLTEERLKEIFILEINEKITGAISDRRRYGWIFYFNEITDISLLFKIDNLINGFFARLPDFKGKPPIGLKRISKAFYKSKYNPMDGYIHNYSSYETIEQKLAFLIGRGVLDPGKKITDDSIEHRFEIYKSRRLSELEADDAQIY